MNAKSFVFRIVLGRLTNANEKASNLPPFGFVCLSLNVTRALRYWNIVHLVATTVNYVYGTIPQDDGRQSGWRDIYEK